MSFTLSNPMCSARRPAYSSDGLIQFFVVAFIYLFVYTRNVYRDVYLFRVHSKETRRACRRCSPIERRPETN